MKYVPGGLQQGDEVLVKGQWCPVIGYSLSIDKGVTTGTVFTTHKHGEFDGFGYRIDYNDIEDHRRPELP